MQLFRVCVCGFLLGGALLSWNAAFAAPAVYLFRPALHSTLGPQAAGQLTVRALDAGRSESVLILSGLTPGSAYAAQYHALGGQAGASACDSDGPVTLGFPAFTADAQGRASVKLSADAAKLSGKAGAYVHVHLASGPTGAGLCASLLNVEPAPVVTLPAAQASGPQISVTDNAFRPTTLSIKVGETVTWTHDGQITHNVKSIEAGGPQSADLHRGDSYRFTFRQTGVFAFYCSYHEGMSGTITVTNR